MEFIVPPLLIEVWILEPLQIAARVTNILLGYRFHGSHRCTGIFICISKPYETLRAQAVNVIHHGYFSVLLIHVGLIDAQHVNL